MPVKKSRVMLKTALLAPAGSLIGWGIQQIVTGDAVTGGVATVIGVGFLGAFVLIQEYDIPYEEELVALIAENKDRFDAETVKTISEEVSDEVERRGITSESDGSDESE
mgnify:CR=1 FL=1